jgi:hypothetical protein
MAPLLDFEKLFREENCLLSHADESSTKQTVWPFPVGGFAARPSIWAC